MTVVATAGHVDHGKSSLVLALTGTDPDRWAEEKQRGLTIDLGFAQVQTPSGRALELIDVPGHIRFIKNMLAGVGAVRCCLFVVAATEGWKPQSEEHLRILDLLGVRHGVVALTKADPAGPDRARAVTAEILERLAGTALAQSPIVPVDSISGLGLGSLWTAIDEMLDRAPDPLDRARPRLWIDRAFSARGSGTVVTGTLVDGSLKVGDEVQIAGQLGRVRALQRHGQPVQSAGPGHRLAVNVAGVGRADVERGHAVVHPGQWHQVVTFDAQLTVLAALDHAVSRRGAYVAHIGSAEQSVSLRVVGPDAVEPGATSPVRIHLPRPLPLLPGDRFVLRDMGRQETVGGGTILDVDPVLPASKARPDLSADRVIRERGWIPVAELARITGVERAADVGGWVVDPEVARAARAALRTQVKEAGPSGLDLAQLGDRDRALLPSLEGVETVGGRARLAGDSDDLASHPFLVALTASLLAPPPPDGVDRTTLRRLVDLGLVVEADGIYFGVQALDVASSVVARLLRDSPDGVTASAVRSELGTSRKYALPLLGALDRAGITRRRGELRIAGPRLKVD